MKRIISIALAVLILLALAACGGEITQGEVKSKEFTPAHCQFMMVPTVHSDGITSYTTWVYYTYYYPDTYTITIEKWDEKEGKNRQAGYGVTKEVYDAVSVGAEFSYEKDMKPKEPEYIREPTADETETG